MNGYVMVGTNDLTSAKKFYDKLLSVLNISGERKLLWGRGKNQTCRPK